MMHLNTKTFSWIGLTCILLLLVLLPFSLRPVIGQPTSNYCVTVNSTTPDSPMYAPVGMNLTLSFQAFWSYGEDSGPSINNAFVSVQVNSSKSEVIDTILVNTNNGFFSFNFSSSTADVLTFTPINLVTETGSEYNFDVVNPENDLYGLQSESVVVWWDTFQVSLVTFDTKTLGTTMVSVNVTYLLLPEEGLTLPEWATYSHQTFLPKIVQNANVAINGENARKTSIAGVYSANVSTWLPTTYVHVGVSQENWITTHTGFSFAHNANEPIWTYVVMIGLALIVAILIVKLIKSGKNALSLENYPFLGGVLLIIISIISLYWGLVGLDNTLHGFDWIPLTLFGLLSFGLGLVSGVLSIRKHHQALVIFSINFPMITNLIFVKYSLDLYGLDIQWLILIASFVLSLICAFLICNTDEEFT
jgi:hypothetical protein